MSKFGNCSLDLSLSLSFSPLVYDVHEHYGDGPAVKSREEYQLEPGERQGQGRDVLENLSEEAIAVIIKKIQGRTPV